MQREDSLTLALRVIPFSLPQHRFAAPAARLLACAREAGHFDGMLNALFAGQDSLGLKDWTQYAEVAGWHAGVAADGCARSNAPVKFLDDARAFGDRIGLQSTPTVVINGFRLNRVPTRAELVDARDRVRAGRPPFEDSKAQ
jgi:protein-disulfide isomerase